MSATIGQLVSITRFAECGCFGLTRLGLSLRHRTSSFINATSIQFANFLSGSSSSDEQSESDSASRLPFDALLRDSSPAQLKSLLFKKGKLFMMMAKDQNRFDLTKKSNGKFAGKF
jgi:hypothetical protein